MNIVKQGLKNYLLNLKYFFVPLGTLFLGVILGLSITIPLFSATLGRLGEGLSALSLTFDLDAFADSLGIAVGELDWANPLNAIGTMFSRSWLEGAFSACLRDLLPNYDQYVVEIETLAGAAINDVIGYVVTIGAFVALGFFGGFFLTKYLIRQEIAKRSIWQFLAVTAIDGLLSATLVALCTYLLSLWSASALFSTLVSYFLFATISLFEAYLCHGVHKVPAKKVVNFRNSSRLILTDSIVIGVAWLLSSGTAILFNELAGAVIGFTLMEIAFIVISLNAESYVLSLPREDGGSAPSCAKQSGKSPSRGKNPPAKKKRESKA